MNLFFWRKKTKKEEIKAYERMNFSTIKEFDKWLDNILEQEIPEEVVAIYFCIHNYESDLKTWTLDFMGTSSFDKEDDDWACDYIYDTYDQVFVLEKELSEDDEYAEEIEKYYIKEIKNYLKTGKYSDKLKTYKAVAVGHEDGELTNIYIKK